MIFEAIVSGALLLYLIVDYFTYKKWKFLLECHNSLLLYHHTFLQSKYKDYGEPED